MDYTNLDFLGYNADQRKLLHLLALAQVEPKNHPLVLMAAPSFVVDFDYKTFVPKMRALGFDKVTELTFGAKIVNGHYHKYIHDHYSSYLNNGKKKDKKLQDKFISSVCPASVELVKHQHPELKKFLLPFASPMGAMAKIVRKNFPKHTIVFLSPCSAKKHEAEQYFEGKGKKGKRLIDCAVTFAEMKQIVAKEKPVARGSNNFDSFYNEFTRVYPLSGGLSATLHYKGILQKREMVSCDGCINLEKLFDSHPNKVFYDVLFCNGGCIGGPGVATYAPINARKHKVCAYRGTSKNKTKNKKIGLDKYTKGIDFSKKF